MVRNPFPAPNPYVRYGIAVALAFALGFCAGQFAMGLALKPDSYTFPTYRLTLPTTEPDT